MGRVGRKLLADFAAELAGARNHLWNSKRPLVFLMVILQRTGEVTNSGAIRHLLLNQIEHWRKGWTITLVDNTKVEMRCRQRSGEPDTADILKEGRYFEGQVMAGGLREAVRILTNQVGGGPLQLDDINAKTIKLVIDVLWSKHPIVCEPL